MHSAQKNALGADEKERSIDKEALYIKHGGKYTILDLHITLNLREQCPYVPKLGRLYDYVYELVAV